MAKNSTSFKKGDPRINRKGRPKKGQSLSDKFKDMLNEVLDPATGYTVLDSMLDAEKNKALKGDQAALEYVLARAFGKMIERVETNNTTKTYDFTDKPLDERQRLLELIKGANTTVPSDNTDESNSDT